MNKILNSVDPDQTAPEEQSDQGLHCLHKQITIKICIRNAKDYLIRANAISFSLFVCLRAITYEVEFSVKFLENKYFLAAFLWLLLPHFCSK